MIQELEELGNPFLDDGSELYGLDTKKVANKDPTLLVIESSGKEQYKEYHKTRIESQTVAVSATIQKNRYCLFSSSEAKILM